MMIPYEYHNGKLGVQGKYLFGGRGADANSLCLIGDRGFRQRVERGGVVKLRDGGGADTPMLVLFDSLPAKWQEAVVRAWGKAPEQGRQTLLERCYVRDMGAFDFYTTYKFADGKSLTRDNIDQYTTNASVLNAIGRAYEERYRLRKELRGSITDIWESLTAESNLLAGQVGHNLPENVRRLRDKYNAYKKDGYEALIHKLHGKTNALLVDNRHAELLNNLFAGLAHKPNYAEVAQLYEAFLNGYVEVTNATSGEVYEPAEFSRLSVATVWNHLTKWENKIGTWSKRSDNRQRLMQLFKPHHKLDQPRMASSIISVDDRQPPFVYEGNRRVWFYNGIDVGSEAFTCWVWGTSKEGIILDFYRQMVRNYAEWGLPLPAELEGEMSLNAGYRNSFLREGNMFQYVRIEANNARGKRIERYYRDLRYGYEKEREGWLARPNALSEANQPLTELRKKTVLPYDEIVQGCLRDIERWNNSEHSKIKGMSRWEVFCRMQNPDLRPTNYHGILPYLGYHTITRVRAGIVRFRSSQFLLGMDGRVCVGAKLLNYMQQVEGKRVDVYWLDDNKGGVLKAYLYMDKRFVCEAVPQPSYNRARAERTPQDEANRQRMSQYVATIEAFARNRGRELDSVQVVDNRPRTIGTSFKIEGLNTYVGDVQSARILADAEPAEPMPVPSGETPSLMNRF